MVPYGARFDSVPGHDTPRWVCSSVKSDGSSFGSSVVAPCVGVRLVSACFFENFIVPCGV
ncbi:hypothetical protein 7S3_35 [uncultured Caudovirales phage]|uniref:Uncharacterized protein n=1 Tax=uncultured Caudovirales phage TaxID=2100421 RepID=A0A2H4J5B1_9CAUD|nr:hypothetical protein 7S3_35 [uncultured Caudovirales phage]